MEWIALGGSVVTALGALLGTWLSNRASTKLMAYRIEQVEKNLDQLEKKVGVHNNFEGRLIALETHVKDLHSA